MTPQQKFEETHKKLCPDCGGAMGRKAQRCRPCHRAALAADPDGKKAERRKEVRAEIDRRYRESHLEERRAIGAVRERHRRAEGKVIETQRVCPLCGDPMDRHAEHEQCRTCYLVSLGTKAEEKFQQTVKKETQRRKARSTAARVARRKDGERWREHVMQLLGGAHCCRCGFSDMRALQIDHIHGDGRLELELGGRMLWLNRVWVRTHSEELQKRYQVLCANCNWIKRDENGEQRTKRNFYAEQTHATST